MRVSLLSKFGVENHTPHPLVGMQIAVQFIKKNVPFVGVRSKSSKLDFGDQFIPVQILSSLSVDYRD